LNPFDTTLQSKPIAHTERDAIRISFAQISETHSSNRVT
jgi:hypothetical protein